MPPLESDSVVFPNLNVGGPVFVDEICHLETKNRFYVLTQNRNLEPSLVLKTEVKMLLYLN